VQSNFHCNYFEWVNELEFTFEGKESEFESSGGKVVEEDKSCLKKDKVIMDLIKKNEKLNRKLQQEKKLEKFCNFYLFCRGCQLLFWSLWCC